MTLFVVLYHISQFYFTKISFQSPPKSLNTKRYNYLYSIFTLDNGLITLFQTNALTHCPDIPFKKPEFTINLLYHVGSTAQTSKRKDTHMCVYFWLLQLDSNHVRLQHQFNFVV